MNWNGHSCSRGPGPGPGLLALRIPQDYEITGFNNMVNNGSDRLRFPVPVPSGCRIHARSRVKSVEQVKSGVKLTMEINVHVVGQDDRPCAVNDMIIMYM